MFLLIAGATHGLVLSSGLAPPARAGVPVAALGEPTRASADFPADLSALTRRELQQLAKRMGVRANQKSVDMITQLHALVAAEASGAAEPQQAEQRAPSEPRQDASPPERRQEASAPERAPVIGAEPQTRFSGVPTEVRPTSKQRTSPNSNPNPNASANPNPERNPR